MGGNWRAVAWLSVMVLACSLITLMLVYRTISLHPDAAGYMSIVTPAHAETTTSTRTIQVVNITDDPGGSVGEYYRRYKALSDAGTEIHFHGGCYSSCTLVFLKEFTGLRACADEGAFFAFHQPFEEHGGKINRSKAARKETRALWAAWLAALPDPLRKYLQGVRVPSATEGDEQNTLLLIPGNLLLPKCPVSVAAQ